MNLLLFFTLFVGSASVTLSDLNVICVEDYDTKYTFFILLYCVIYNCGMYAYLHYNSTYNSELFGYNTKLQ